jgi:starvation-inducible outer membrane lipoprotein
MMLPTPRIGVKPLSLYFLLLLIGLLITGCASVPKDYPRTESTAFKNYLDTAAG